MKRSMLVLVLCVLLSPPCEAGPGKPLNKGLFVTVLQDPQVLSSREEIKKLVDYARHSGVKTLFVQIYRANQAWFPSEVGDTQAYQKILKNVGEDPFALLIKEAHGAGIEVHAWLNMLSLSKNKEAPILKKYGQGILTTNRDKKSKIEDYEIDNQYFLEPGDLRVRKDLLDMVEEILKGYPDLDGVQFDYIRYPDEKPFYGYTEMNMARFRESTGAVDIREDTKEWKNWKRRQVTEFLEELVGMTRKMRPDIRISTTGCAPYSRAYHEAFQEWGSWLKKGLVDFVTVMTYSPDAREFARYVNDAKEHAKNRDKLNIAVGAYELKAAPIMFDREIDLCARAGVGACVIFHYGSLIENPELGKIFVKK